MNIHGLTKALAVFGMIIDTDKDFQRHIFKKFDLDNEKEITYNDFSATIASFVGSNTDDDSLQTLFEIFDIDQDGYLELEDMARVYVIHYVICFNLFISYYAKIKMKIKPH